MFRGQQKGIKGIRKIYVGIAKDLCYDQNVIDKINLAKTENEISMIMTKARTSSQKGGARYG